MDPPNTGPAKSSETQEAQDAPQIQSQDFAQHLTPPQAQAQPPRLPSLRTANDGPKAANMTASSTPLGSLNAARRPNLPQASAGGSRGSQLPQDMQAKMKAFHLSRQGVPPPNNLRMPQSTVAQSNSTTQLPTAGNTIPGGPAAGGLPPSTFSRPQSPHTGGSGNLRLPPGARPQAPAFPNSAPAVPGIKMNPKMGGLAAKRGLNKGMKLSDASGPAPSSDLSQAQDTSTANLEKVGDKVGETLCSVNTQNMSILKQVP